MWVDLGLPSGTKWAKTNVDVSQENGFAVSELQYECSFFSWANVDGHNPIDDHSFGDWSFGSVYNGEPYISSPGARVLSQSMMDLAHDAAYISCGLPWRLPTRADAEELLNPVYTEFVDANGQVIDPSLGSVITEIDGIACCRIRSKVNGNIIVFACTGFGAGSSWQQRGTRLSFWTSTFDSISNAILCHIGDTVDTRTGDRHYGRVIRPVFK